MQVNCFVLHVQVDAAEKTAERDIAVQEKERLAQEKERVVQENESLSRVVQKTIQRNEETLREKDAVIQRLQVYCVQVQGEYIVFNYMEMCEEYVCSSVTYTYSS